MKTNYQFIQGSKGQNLVAANPEYEALGAVWKFRTEEQMQAWLSTNPNPYSIIPGHRVLIVLLTDSDPAWVHKLAKAYADKYHLSETESRASFKRFRNETP